MSAPLDSARLGAQTSLKSYYGVTMYFSLSLSLSLSLLSASHISAIEIFDCWIAPQNSTTVGAALPDQTLVLLFFFGFFFFFLSSL
jgi:hypothetical protein